MKIKPLSDRVVIEPSEAEEVTQGGIILPDTAKEKPLMGKVTAVGEGKMLKNGETAEMSVKVGDLVAFGRFAGTDFKVDGKEYKIMHESDILGVIE
ncbi:co-chaperone GroES [Sedimentisphaera salicampi]|uniref:Co-chaperonin GroES n=1 Tax=Sedimentisphaera salicampi TaxID=1941349 RepID=A0A1W6LP59_9BACT|nr:co-chaperone GroES [Sedimentisphaera salicampi]ARN57523.1 co-chaperonin GroES [Sedimentisphaera salicampi]OXU14385.1 co-chaperonin GroES [Sedimentisphaera salicampi]